jgi:hypothetical protein
MIASTCQRSARHLLSCALLAVALLAALPAHAWGPITHAYIASQIFPDAPPALLFGAMVADLNGFSGLGEEGDSALKHLTHREAKLLAPSPFELGLLTHDGDWGADSYAHAYFHMPTEKKYPLRVFERLSSDTGITMNNAEDVIETLLDYVICRDMGRAFVRKILDAVNAVGPAEEQALVDAYTGPLMERMPELTREKAEKTLRKAFQCEKAALKCTACFMLTSDKYQRAFAPYMIWLGTGIPFAVSGDCTRRGIELCADWRPSLDQIAREMGAKMRELKFMP